MLVALEKCISVICCIDLYGSLPRKLKRQYVYLGDYSIIMWNFKATDQSQRNTVLISPIYGQLKLSAQHFLIVDPTLWNTPQTDIQHALHPMLLFWSLSLLLHDIFFHFTLNFSRTGSHLAFVKHLIIFLHSQMLRSHSNDLLLILERKKRWKKDQ